MVSALEKLVGIAGPPTLGAPSSHASLQALLSRKNGFYAFEGALHVFADGDPGHEYGLEQWNSEASWRCEYEGLAGGVFFAEDVFGAQFCLVDGVISSFDPETGTLESMARSLDEWASMILDDYPTLTGYPLAHEWQRAHGPLPRGHRLVPITPFVLGGAFAIENLHVLDAVEGMLFRASIARQIRDLPDGTAVRLEIVE